MIDVSSNRFDLIPFYFYRCVLYMIADGSVISQQEFQHHVVQTISVMVKVMQHQTVLWSSFAALNSTMVKVVLH